MKDQLAQGARSSVFSVLQQCGYAPPPLFAFSSNQWPFWRVWWKLVQPLERRRPVYTTAVAAHGSPHVHDLCALRGAHRLALAAPAHPKKTHGMEAASAIGRYVERRPWPCGVTSQTVNNLQNTWGLPRCAGLPWRPLLLHPEAVETFFNAAGNVIYTSDVDFFNQESSNSTGLLWSPQRFGTVGHLERVFSIFLGVTINGGLNRNKTSTNQGLNSIVGSNLCLFVVRSLSKSDGLDWGTYLYNEEHSL